MKLSIDSIHSSITDRLRRRRFAFFEELLQELPRPVRILDCGGTVDFWQTIGTAPFSVSKLNITILNLFEAKDLPPGFVWHVGDVRDLSRFSDQQFDVVFSNAVINLMPSQADQYRMAREIMRVGKRYFVQSPNRHFPIDWRTLVPFFHFLSPQVQAWCFAHFRVGTYARVTDPAKALLLATRVRDLSVREMQAVFPGCSLFRERFFGFTKSIAAYDGWK